MKFLNRLFQGKKHRPPSTPEEIIAHHTALLSPYRPRDSAFLVTCESFARLHLDLVPDLDQAETMQGEAIRAVNRLAGEDRRNGCMNWDSGFEKFIDFLRPLFSDPEAFSPEQTLANAEALDLISLNGRDEQASDEVSEAFAVLIQSSVNYCEHNKELIARELDSELNR